MSAPTADEMRCWRDAIRAFNQARGTHRRPHATTLRELSDAHPTLRASIVGTVLESSLKFYWR